MRILSALLGVALSGCFAFCADAPVEIRFERFTLSNGLTVLVHEDHKAPIVAVNIWYHVGSKNERTGKTGFAHLFEHLMFNGSEHFNDDYFKVLEKLGATDLNGTTNNDRTNYFQNVPTAALDTVLWMESDRMGHLLGAIDQKRLDEQRGVVQNEKRQGENQPYGIDDEIISANTYPAGHPYSWDVIGSMDDLNAASLKDVQEWFKTYYGPSNAVLTLAGDIDSKSAHEKAEKFFGALPPGPPIVKQHSWISKMSGEHRGSIEERVPQPRLYKVWNTPEYLSKDDMLLDLAGQILGGGKTSRLYKRLVYKDQTATQAIAFESSKEIASQFEIQITGKAGSDLSRIEQAVDEEIARFLAEGPTERELQQAKTQFVAGFVRGSERIGGFGGKSDTLATYQVFTGDAANYRNSLQVKQNATIADIKRVSNQWLRDGVYALEVHPFTEWKPAAVDADRTKMPDPGKPSTLKMPALQRATLPNGLKVVLAERRQTPLVEMSLLLDAGYAADQSGVPGSAGLAMAMLTEGAAGKSAPEISDELALLGANLGAGCNLDTCTVTLSTLKSTLPPALDLMANMTIHPDFPQSEFERVRKQRIASIQAEKADPIRSGLRVLSAVTYGASHPYGTFSGTGTEASVQSISRDMLVKFHQSWFKPNHATLLVTGDASLSELMPLLEKAFGSWPQGDIPRKQIAEVPQPEKTLVYLVDKPGAEQSVLLTGNFAPARNARDEAAIDAMNAAIGGQFVSRLNMNLREDKHWSYGAGSFMRQTKGERLFVAYAPVQTDKTTESVVEMKKELNEYVHERPITTDEVGMAKSSLSASLPGSLETLGALDGILRDMVEYGLPDDYYPAYAQRVQALDRTQIMAAAERTLRPGGLSWVIVGDRSKIEAGIRKLGLGDLQIVDADGKPLR